MPFGLGIAQTCELLQYDPTSLHRPETPQDIPTAGYLTQSWVLGSQDNRPEQLPVAHDSPTSLTAVQMWVC